MAEFEPVREVRFGLVMYGGVSLAVYINGVAQELFSLVRATAPALDPVTEEPGDRLHHTKGELRSAESVYRQVGRMYGDPDAGPTTAGPVRTRFVVDIISGSSAGGINGVYLAKALANEQDIEALRTLWVTKAGVADLLNDKQTRKPRKDRMPDPEPAEALFSGDLMYLELLDALDAMDRTRPGQGPDHAPPSPYVNDLDLWLTATDLAGTPMPLRLSDRTILEKRHRHTFHFVFGEAQHGTKRRNDFARDQNPLLAFAARATSAFPFAFVPARLADIGRVRRVQGKVMARPDPKDVRWRPWFRNQRQVEGFDYENVSFGDGGDTDNKPFGWVIDTLPSRVSTSLVDRRLLYVEPDPGDPTVISGEAAPRPDVIGSTVAAVSLGRVENIRDDLDRLARMSTVRERLAAVHAAVDARYRKEPKSEALEVSTVEWLREPLEVMAGRGLSYAAYYTLRVESLVTEFARALVGLPWHSAETPESAAMRALVAQWVRTTFVDPFEQGGPEARTTKHFLFELDIAFRIRRLVFVAGQADRLYRLADRPGDLAAELGIQAPDDLDWPQRFRAEARRLKGVMGAAEKALRLHVPSVRSNPESAPTEFVLSDAEVEAFSRAPEQWAVETCRARGAALSKLAEDIAAYLAAVFDQARKPVKAALSAEDGGPAEQAARHCIGQYYARFADFDQVTFPLHAAAGTTGEADPVQVHRISPLDAPTLVDPEHSDKVAGDQLGHFGGFLDARWRANDIMWGRLDTAERLIRCLVPEAQGADELLRQAHDAILCEEWYARGRGGEAHLGEPWATADDPASRTKRIDTFRRDYKPPPWPPASELLPMAARASRVTSEMLEGVAGTPGVGVLRRVVAAAAWVLTAVTMVLLPGNRLRLPLRSLAAVTAVIGGVLTALGIVLNWDPAATTGRTLLGVGLAALLVLLIVRLVVRKVRRR